MIQNINNIEILFYQNSFTCSDEYIDFFDEEDDANPFNIKKIVYRLEFYNKIIFDKAILILMKHDLFSDERSLFENKMTAFKKMISKKEIKCIEECIESELNKMSSSRQLDLSAVEALDMRVFARQTGRSYIDRLFLSKMFYAKMTAKANGRHVSMLLQLPCPPDFKYILGTSIFAMKVI